MAKCFDLSDLLATVTTGTGNQAHYFYSQTIIQTNSMRSVLFVFSNRGILSNKNCIVTTTAVHILFNGAEKF